MTSIIAPCSVCGVKNRIPDTRQHLMPRCGKCGDVLELRQYVVPVELGDSNLVRFLAACSLPVLVDFYAPGCGPCQSLAPVLEKLTRRYFGRVVICKVDTNSNPGSAVHYQIRGVPTLIFFKEGRQVEQLVGAPHVTILVAKLDVLAG